MRLPSSFKEKSGLRIGSLRARTVAQLGRVDADYIRRVVAAVRYISLFGRLLLFVGAIGGAFVSWLFWPACIAGTVLLGLAKILENMEVDHNVMHGQYDWMRDPHLDG